MTDLTRKITVASMNSIRGGWAKPSKKSFVARFAGKAAYCEEKQTQFGPYAQFGGYFIAWNAKGDRHESNHIILPEPAQGMVRAAIATNNGNTIEFGVDVFIEPDSDPRNARGYRFTCATVFENVDEGLARLEKSLPKLPMIGKD